MSDTHGLLRPEALAALAGVDRIIHAGDIGGPEILAALRRIAPVAAVRGNNDRHAWTDSIPERRALRIGGMRILALHDVKELRREPAPRGTQLVIAGHSHVPVVREEDGVLYLNPGSAGPRRFKLPVSVAMLEIAGGKAAARLITLL